MYRSLGGDDFICELISPFPFGAHERGGDCNILGRMTMIMIVHRERDRDFVSRKYYLHRHDNYTRRVVRTERITE